MKIRKKIKERKLKKSKKEKLINNLKKENINLKDTLKEKDDTIRRRNLLVKNIRKNK